MKRRSATFSASARRPWLALLLAWSVLVGQLVTPGVLLAAAAPAATMSICTGSGTATVPDPTRDAPSNHPCHDLCGLCCSICHAPVALCPPTLALLQERHPAQAPPIAVARPVARSLLPPRPPGRAPPLLAIRASAFPEA